MSNRYVMGDHNKTTLYRLLPDHKRGKLYYIQPKSVGCRQYKVKLSRLRIGYSRLIHGHLMLRNDQRVETRD